jgi:hypothetical protein
MEVDPAHILNSTAGEDFDEIAELIMNRSCLAVKDPYLGIVVHFRILEIEFYLHADGHEDTYVHCRPQQQTVGQWYIHPRAGTFKGIDLTFGRGAYGGILIRAMMAEDGTVIEGPSKVVDQLITVTGARCVRTLDSAHLKVEPRVSPQEDPRASPYTSTLYTSARIGLNPATDPDYVVAPYRYVAEPHLLKKPRAITVMGMADHHALDRAEITALMRGPK